MINNLTPDLPIAALVPPTDIDRLFSLIAIIKDPDAARQRLDQIATASAEVWELHKGLQQTRQALSDWKDSLERERQAELEKLLTTGRATLEAEKRRRDQDYSRREVEIAAKEKAAADNFESCMKMVRNLKAAFNLDQPLAAE